MDHEKAARATRKFTRTMSDPEGTALIELMARVVIEARKVKNPAAPLRAALDALDTSAVRAALASYTDVDPPRPRGIPESPTSDPNFDSDPDDGGD